MKKIRTEEIFEEDLANEQEWEVEKIMKERTKIRKNKKTGKMQECKEYLIKWVGYKTPSWEPEDNLEHSQEILKEFLLKQIMKKLEKNKKKKTIQTPSICRYEKSPSLTEYKIESTKLTESANEEEPSTFSNSVINYNTTIKNKKNRKSKKSLLSKKEKKDKNKGDAICYDIEIEDGCNGSEKDFKYETEEKSHCDKSEGNKEYENNKNKKIPYNSKVIDDVIDEDLTSIDQISHSIYLDKEEEEVFINDKEEKKTKNDEKSITRYLEKKRFNSTKDVSNDEKKKMKENIIKDNKMKILEIYSIKVPNDPNEGIVLNVKFKKNNKIYIEEMNTKKGEIPNDYLLKYYETFICQIFKGQNLLKELSFD